MNLYQPSVVDDLRDRARDAGDPDGAGLRRVAELARETVLDEVWAGEDVFPWSPGTGAR